MDDILEKTLVMVKDHPIDAPDTDPLSNGGEEDTEPKSNGGGIRLFKHSTPGLVLDHIGKHMIVIQYSQFLPN